MSIESALAAARQALDDIDTAAKDLVSAAAAGPSESALTALWDDLMGVLHRHAQSVPAPAGEPPAAAPADTAPAAEPAPEVGMVTSTDAAGNQLPPTEAQPAS